MKRQPDKKARAKGRFQIHHVVNTHHWATKTEMQHFLSGNPDLKIQAAH